MLKVGEGHIRKGQPCSTQSKSQSLAGEGDLKQEGEGCVVVTWRREELRKGRGREREGERQNQWGCGGRGAGVVGEGAGESGEGIH